MRLRCRRSAATERLPIFVSGIAFPDWIVIGPEILKVGAEGVRGAGEFGFDWGLDTGEQTWRPWADLDQCEEMPSMPVAPHEILLRLLVALGLGALIGFDRQRREHPAGLRTHILVALASATFMLISTQLVFYQRYGDGEAYRVDSSRIASGVVMGLGFLGAGAIVRSGRGIRGLTTAASLWLVAALGMASAAGMYILSALATVAALFVLIVLRRWERRASRGMDLVFTLVLRQASPDREALLRQVGLTPRDVNWLSLYSDIPSGTTRLTFEVVATRPQELDSLLGKFTGLPGVTQVRAERPWSAD